MGAVLVFAAFSLFDVATLRVQDRLQIEGRAANHLEHVDGGSLLLRAGAMKPYPRSALKNLTRPVGIFQLAVNAINGRGKAPGRNSLRGLLI